MKLFEQEDEELELAKARARAKSKTKSKPDKKTSADKSTPDKPKEDVKVTPSDIKIKIFSPGREQLHIDNWEFVRAIQKSIESNDKDNKVY